MRARVFAVLIALIAMCAISAAPVVAASTTGQPPLPTVELSVGGKKVTAEVANTVAQRAEGLMYRFSLRPDHGMVFVFARSEPQGFWMKNTFIALSIAFIDSNGRILNIEDMAPQSETTHWSKGSAQYALEMRKGWFRDKGVGPGDVVKGLPKPGNE